MPRINIKQKRFLLPVLFVVCYLGSSFLPRLNPNLFSDGTRFWYVLSFFMFLPIIAIIGIITFIYILIKRIFFKKKSPIIAAVTIVLITTSIICFPPVAFTHKYLPRALPSGADKMKFNSSSWKNYKNRQQMIKDLVNNVLPDKNKDEICSLLGPSQKTTYFLSIDKDFIYYTGPERDGFMNMDSEWLLIWVDKNAVFEKYEIYND
ncbi:hypothetical protein ACFL96_05625 [Thermoproteota archaeon]